MNVPTVHSPTAGLKPQDRRALIVGAIALVLMLGYARVLKPAASQLSADRDRLHDQTELLRREQSLVANATKLATQSATLRRNLAKESPRLFDGDSVGATAALTSYVTALAQVSQVRLTAVEAHAPHSALGVTTLVVEMRGEGSWRSVLSLVRSLETATKLVDVLSLRLERGPRGGPLGGDQITISATVNGFSRSEP